MRAFRHNRILKNAAPSPDAKSLIVSRNLPVFATATSSDLRPRVAAQEAFDIAASALPRAPNVCFLQLSVDHGDMLDAVAGVWNPLLQADPSSTMVGQVSRQQRFGGNNFLELMLGYIPQLESQFHSFDALPTSVPSDCFGAIALVDWRLCAQHLDEINRRLDAVSRACSAPLVGGVLPPAEVWSDDNSDAASSLFAYNGNLVRGGAGIVVLRSPRMLPFDVLQSQPSAPLGGPFLVESELRSGQWIVHRVGDKKATEVIRAYYEDQLASWPECKVFAAVSLKSGEQLPLAFRGSPQDGSLIISLPPALTPDTVDFSSISFVCDSPMHDRVAIASDLAAMADAVNPISYTETVTVAREARRVVTVSTVGSLAWSCPQLYEVVQRPTLGVTLDVEGHLSSEVHVPSVASRVLHGRVATTGIHCGGQIMPLSPKRAVNGLDRVSAVTARASSHVVMRAAD